MTKFFNKFKTSFSGPFLAYLPNFEGKKKKNYRKSGSHAQLHVGFWHEFLVYAKIYRKLMIQIQENVWRDGKMEGWTEGQKDDRKDGQTLFYRSLLVTSR